MTSPSSALVSRGRALAKLAVAGAAVAASPLRSRLTSGSTAAAAASASVACVLTPELTEGPYFLSRTTRNVGDQIFSSGGAASLLRPRKSATGRYVGTLAIGVRRSS